MHRIPLNDLSIDAVERDELLQAMQKVVESGWFVLGPEVEAFEQEFASYCGVTHCVGVANGTDALELALRALGAGPGTTVATVANAGAYTATAALAIGAIPAFVDIDSATLNMDPASLAVLLSHTKVDVLVITHLFGRMAALPELLGIARRHGLLVIEDCAQAHGAMLDGRRAGSFGDAACFSFYPTKNLGALGDGGAVVTGDARAADRLRSLRQYGWGAEKYSVVTDGGRNSRLDELQAAVLRVRLRSLDSANARRRSLAQRYVSGLPADLTLHCGQIGDGYVGHLFVVSADDRDAFRERLADHGIGSAVHYPVLDHHQSGIPRGPRVPLEQSEKALRRILTLPLYPSMPDEAVTVVCQHVSAILESNSV